ncbi:MAG: glycoside hydrolase [Chloroflexi bacterium]|nr:glycoside hydrolase [Chloroflexota bacterium]
MLVKNYTKTGNYCRVTFKLPAEVETETAVLCGDFTNWDEKPMKQLKDGSFSVTLSMPAPQTYRFRYLLDDGRWENDWEADAYEPNEHGSDDSILTV